MSFSGYFCKNGPGPACRLRMSISMKRSTFNLFVFDFSIFLFFFKTAFVAVFGEFPFCRYQLVTDFQVHFVFFCLRNFASWTSSILGVVVCLFTFCSETVRCLLSFFVICYFYQFCSFCTAWVNLFLCEELRILFFELILVWSKC